MSPQNRDSWKNFDRALARYSLNSQSKRNFETGLIRALSEGMRSFPR